MSSLLVPRHDRGRQRGSPGYDAHRRQRRARARCSASSATTTTRIRSRYYVPRQNVSFGAEDARERDNTLQKSRRRTRARSSTTRGATGRRTGPTRHNTSPRRWTLPKLLQKKTDLRATYDYSHAVTQYIYGLAPNSTLVVVAWGLLDVVLIAVEMATVGQLLTSSSSAASRQ